MTRTLSCAVVSLVAFPALLSAHPGHGTTEPNSVSHYFFEPLHSWPLIGIVAVGVGLFAVRFWKRASR